ncbi:hypothetical protein QAD02_004196 [Eretmocerus hayati]|uniref:Uncharacterized protein n=2 Tax=Eretmocerus hayati TaxID=131215 RepID=A0ACC2NP11_9HYME|nr:hypothetical protein QAD02_004191 [Eretmocerus hayati]KAJ8672935.1 hypothetical protein QAD02_004196 [Eretmocerus hayati]
MLDPGAKKRKVSKKTKKSWRKHVDVKDVDSFLENVRSDERLGAPFSARKDEELFVIDTSRNDAALNKITASTKQQRRELLKKTEPRCYAILKPHTAVPDPISKRNRVRTPEERKSSITRRIETERRLKGQLKLKERLAIKNRLLAKEKRANRPKKGQFDNDVWKEEPNKEQNLSKNEWLDNDTIRHTLANTGKKRKRVPQSLYKKKSAIPAVTAPHPGTSYNPSFADHQELLSQLAADEQQKMKEEKHLHRVTDQMFRKVTQKQKESDNLKEMSEGLPLQNSTANASEDEDDDPTVKSVNPPAKNVKKTLVQRRKIKEQQKLQQNRLKEKLEKKKVADIYHLKQLGKQMLKKQKKEEVLRQKRLKVKAKKELEPKVLSRNKFEPLEQEFQLGEELSGSLRSANPAGNLLKDRYKSLQQRNIVAPGAVVMKSNKAKVKRFIKPDHKLDFDKFVK